MIKKLFFIVSFCLLFVSGTPALAVSQTNSSLALGKTYKATLKKCVDGDTAHFVINGTSYKARFLLIDTPESTIKQEAYGKEASTFTCNLLQKGNITVETDGKDLFDKYNRLLVWVFVGDTLQQEAVTKAGLVKKFYDYGDYKYENRVREAMKTAQTQHVGMYQNQPVQTQPTPTQPKEKVNVFVQFFRSFF